MKPPSSAIQARLDEVRGRVARAAGRAGRDPAGVVLVGVVKTVPAELIREAVALGLADLGENRVQEAEGHIAALGRTGARWHMIGHLQRNKAGRAVELFDRVHGGRLGGAGRGALAARGGGRARMLPVLVEVNVSGEATKFGVAPEAVEGLLERVAVLPGLSLDGLMTVGRRWRAPTRRGPGSRGCVRCAIAAERALGRRLPELSMGMSGDFEVAVEEGATLVRVGTALFGERS